MEATLKCYNPVWNEIVFIPRIELRSDVTKGGFLWKRRQFPVQPALSMTMNKSQGQNYTYIFTGQCLATDNFMLHYPGQQSKKMSK